MFDPLFKAWAHSPWILIILALPSLFTVGLVWAIGARAQRSRRSRGIRGAIALVFGLVLVWLGASWLATCGQTPEAVYLVERDGEQRLAVLSESTGRGGTYCRVFTWQLPDGDWVGGDGGKGDCEPRSRGAWLKPYKIRNIRNTALWRGRFGESLGTLAARSGPLPGEGALRLTALGHDSATVSLQDGSSRELRWDDGGERVTRLEIDPDPYPLELPAVFSPHLIGGPGIACGCARPPCGDLIRYESVAFGEGERKVGLVTTDGAPALVWSVGSDALFGSDAPPIFGVLADGDHCLLVAGRSGGRVALAWVTRDRGTIVRTLTR